MEITLSGARLGDAQEIIYYQPGITTVSLKKVDDNNVKAKIKIAPDCALGLHDLRVQNGDRHQRAAHVQRRRTQGNHRSRAQQRLRGSAGDRR